MQAGAGAAAAVWEDRSLPHQIVLRYAAGRQHLLAVTCNCLGKDNIAVARLFGPGEPQRLWREYHGWTTTSAG